MDRAYISLKQWYLCFDAKDEFMKFTWVWIKLSSLLIEHWLNLSLKDIWDTLGKLILSYDSYKSINISLVEKILVKFVVNQGLCKSLDMVITNKIYT